MKSRSDFITWFVQFWTNFLYQKFYVKKNINFTTSFRVFDTKYRMFWLCQALYVAARLRACARITYHFGISARQKDGGSVTSGHLWPILIRKIREIASYSATASLRALWFCSIGSSKSNPNLIANSAKLHFVSAKLFLRKPLALKRSAFVPEKK